MKGFVFMMLLISCFLVLPVSYGYSCSSKHTASKKEIKQISKKKAVCSASDHQKSGSKKKMCGHSCDGSGCSCVHGSWIFALKTQHTTLINKTVFVFTQPNSWFFKESTPKPVYLSLWMPPNISC
ncbi:hypothetical protein [Dyadobacter frigoris]|uniref:Uncharacterized protein n=1 Tax=Dyadobacter frigoris TaxID=2576211 RepID=A0A4U6D1E4_9BACT|nr:hypothetical protein [Dyadobacter frigoris]TKT87614.1 hypothetical protein FDK13_28920 [Dyadobacter frigoris]